MTAIRKILGDPSIIFENGPNETTVMSFCEKFKDDIGAGMVVFPCETHLSIYINPQNTILLNELVQFCSTSKLGFTYSGDMGRFKIELKQPIEN